MKELKIDGFVTNPTADDAMAIALFGEQGSGKTRFGCTMPDPIGVVALDRKTRKTAERISKEFGKTIIMPKDDFIRAEKPMKLAMLRPDCGQYREIKLDLKVPPECCAIHYYRYHVNRVKHACFKLAAHPEIRSILIDSGTQLWEDILFANYGRAQRIMPRDRGPANQEMIDLLNALSGKNTVITHKAKEVWRNDKPTGRFEPDGFRHIGYHVNLIAECVCDDTKGDDDDNRFVLNVIMCQDNPSIQGPAGKRLLADSLISFQTLAFATYPDSDPEDWI